MARLPEDGSQADRIRQLERKVQQLDRADRLGNTSFREPGKVRFRDADGDIRFLWGANQPGDLSLFYYDGVSADQPAAIVGVVYEQGTDTVIGHGLLVQDPATGKDLLQAWRGGTGGWTFRVRVDDGDTLIDVDGDGQAFPRVPQLFVEGFAGPTVELADGLRTVSEGYVVSTYPAGRMVVRRVVNGTVDARYRVIDNASGTVLVDWQAFTAAGYDTLDFPIDPALWALGSWTRRLVRVEGEVTSGAGSATLHVVGCWVGKF
jgi:hypothetical protein